MRKAMTAAAAVYPGGAMVTVAVCDDGAVLAYAENQNQWVEFPPVPQPEPEAVAATAIDHDHIESRPGVDHLYRIMAWVAGGRSTILVADLKAAIAEITRLRAQPEPVSISSTSQEAAKIDTGSGWREKLTALVELEGGAND